MGTAWPERELAFAAVLAGTGAQASEVRGGRIRDLVFEVEDPYVRVIHCKGNAVRDCPLPPQVATAVQAYLCSRQQRGRARARRDGPARLARRPVVLELLSRQWPHLSTVGMTFAPTSGPFRVSF